MTLNKINRAVILMTLSFLGTLSLSNSGHAGGWGASGGELLGETQNPWWVKNTTQVNYCVEIDQKGISTSPQKINEIVAKSIAFWKTELSRNIDYLENGTQLTAMFQAYGVGAQNFVKTECNGSEDLRFQFGYGTLSLNQKLHIHNPKRFVGMAVRTSYDEVNMKGKGFILIGSDQGSDRFQNDLGQMDKAWSTDLILELVLVHELGHTFGIPHVGAEFSVMSQQGPELIVTQYFANAIKNLPVNLGDIGNFFFPSEQSNTCANTSNDSTSPLPKSLASFYEAPASAKCLIHELDPKTKVITISTSPFYKGPTTKIGEITGATYTGSAKNAVTIHLNNKQVVFKLDPKTETIPFLSGPFFVDVDVTGGTYRANNGDEKPVLIHNGTFENSSIFGGIDGKIQQLY